MSHSIPEPTLTLHDGLWRAAWSDDYVVVLKTLDTAHAGVCRAELEVQYQGRYLDSQTVDLLNARQREIFHLTMAARNGVSPVAWEDKLSKLYHNLQIALAATPTQSPWAFAQTADDFLAIREEDLDATVKDFVIAGCTTIVSAPRGSGKTFVALFLGVALATGGIFRMERLARQRVLLVDRDNAPALIRQRLRNLGATGLTTLKVLTRETAPPLTNKEAWAQFPAEDYDVLIVDSISAFTEGVSEKEGKQTQEFVATLKNLALRGLAILALANTNKAGVNIRGRGEQSDAVDIVYEARNITGWDPDDGPYWWENLPEAGEHAWQHNTTRRMQGAALRIAFVPTKFRLGVQPSPFCLEMDTTQTPWTMTDVTEQVTHDATQALRERKSAERQKLEAAARALAHELRSRSADTPMLKHDAEQFLRDQGHVTRRQARNLLENGFNHDLFADGLWVLREIAGRRGHPVGVYLTAHDPRARGGRKRRRRK